MPSERVVKSVERSGDVRYYPQYRNFWGWHNYTYTVFIPHTGEAEFDVWHPTLKRAIQYIEDLHNVEPALPEDEVVWESE